MPGMHGWGQGGESRLAVLAAACYSVSLAVLSNHVKPPSQLLLLSVLLLR